jgi:uncharacterized protein (TIGR02265 family)
MSLTTAELKRRIDAASTADTVRGIVFNATFALVRRHEGEEAARACDPLSKATRSDFMAFDVRDFLEVSHAAARVLAPTQGGEDGAFRAIGVSTWQALAGGMLGRTLLGLAHGEPRRLADLLGPGYRAVVSYGERTLTWRSERSALVRFERDFVVPPFHCGVLQTFLESLGGTHVRVAGRQTGFLEMEFDVSWD